MREIATSDEAESGQESGLDGQASQGGPSGSGSSLDLCGEPQPQNRAGDENERGRSGMPKSSTGSFVPTLAPGMKPCQVCGCEVSADQLLCKTCQPQMHDEDMSASCSEYSESGTSSLGGQSRGSGVLRKPKLSCAKCGHVARTSGSFCSKCAGKMIPRNAQSSTAERKGWSLGSSASNGVDQVPAGAAAPPLPTVIEEVETKAGQSSGISGRHPPKDCSDEDNHGQPVTSAQIMSSLFMDAGQGQFPLLFQVAPSVQGVPVTGPSVAHGSVSASSHAMEPTKVHVMRSQNCEDAGNEAKGSTAPPQGGTPPVRHLREQQVAVLVRSRKKVMLGSVQKGPRHLHMG